MVPVRKKYVGAGTIFIRAYFVILMSPLMTSVVLSTTLKGTKIERSDKHDKACEGFLYHDSCGKERQY